jgi:tetratricopeptide (TPR) repeat protein
MTEPDRNKLDNVIPFPMEAVRRLGHQRVEKRRPNRLEEKGQQTLFEEPEHGGAPRSGEPPREVFELRTGVGPFEEALLYDEEGDGRAAEMYERAISRGDDTADAYCNLGIIKSRAGDTAAAFDCFTKSLEHDERHIESHYNLANLYFESGDLRLARLHYEIAAGLDPAFPNVFFNLGLVHAMQENYRSAMEALSKYKDLVPGNEGRIADDLLICLERSISG